MRRSWVSSGWNAVARSGPCRTATILPLSSPSTETSAPACSTQGARMNTAWNGATSVPSASSPAAPPSSRSATSRSKESTWRPKALRLAVMTMPPKVCWPATPSWRRSASMISPAHEPNAGMPPAISLRIGSSRSNAVASFHRVVDSPPGMTSPSAASISVRRRTGVAVAPASSSARRCSRTSPCRASTPMAGTSDSSLGSLLAAGTRHRRRGVRGFELYNTQAGTYLPRPSAGEAGYGPWRVRQGRRLPAAGGVVLLGGQGVDVDADHRLAEAPGDLRDNVGVVVERGRLDDRGGALGRVARLEDARADEDALRAELHHHRGVGRGGD